MFYVKFVLFHFSNFNLFINKKFYFFGVEKNCFKKRILSLIKNLFYFFVHLFYQTDANESVCMYFDPGLNI